MARGWQLWLEMGYVGLGVRAGSFAWDGPEWGVARN